MPSQMLDDELCWALDEGFLQKVAVLIRRRLKQVTLFRRQGIRVVGDKEHCQQFAWHCGQRRCHQPSL